MMLHVRRVTLTIYHVELILSPHLLILVVENECNSLASTTNPRVPAIVEQENE
jgi:hypothetical protein